MVLHKKYNNSSYAGDPAADRGGLVEYIEISSKINDYEFKITEPTKKENYLRAHINYHYEIIFQN